MANTEFLENVNRDLPAAYRLRYIKDGLYKLRNEQGLCVATWHRHMLASNMIESKCQPAIQIVEQHMASLDTQSAEITPEMIARNARTQIWHLMQQLEVTKKLDEKLQLLTVMRELQQLC